MSKITGKGFLIGIVFVVVGVIGSVSRIDDVEYKANGYFKSEHLAKRGYYQEYQLDNGKVLRVRGSRGVTPQSEHKYEQCVNNNAEFHIVYKNMHERFYFFETGKFKSFVVYLSCSYDGSEVEVFDIRK